MPYLGCTKCHHEWESRHDELYEKGVEWLDSLAEPSRKELLEALQKAYQEIYQLREWKAGAIGAATILYPPKTGPHTEAAFLSHQEEYLSGSEEYRNGADTISAPWLARKEHQG